MIGKKMIILILAGLIALASCGGPSDWKSRSIYQLLTDRFASPYGGNCGDYGNYCGGTFNATIYQLDYIKNLGFDAIWISPIVSNFGNGYHGYWAQDFYGINYHFGSAQDLKNLVAAAHSKGMYVMVDVVANHAGIPPNYDFSQVNPFNQGYHYHGCGGVCPGSCNIENWSYQEQVEVCRLAGLPDLDQSNSYVRDTLKSWIQEIVSEYQFDGVRVDTVPEVDKSFWQEFQQSAGVYAIGEVFNGDANYVAPYQGGALDSVLSYPMFFALRNVFAYRNTDMSALSNLFKQYNSVFKDPTILGTFVDNHDNARFLSLNNDYSLYKNALAYVIFARGIPILYYGSEQGYSGGNDPNCREPLWYSQYSQTSNLYEFIALAMKVRKQFQVWNSDHVEQTIQSQLYSFSRGNLFIALTNKGQGNNYQTTVYQHPFNQGTRVCSLINTNDCPTVDSNRGLVVSIQNGQPNFYAPA
eukprot:c17147_g1_i1.p1 GENE.c17147_g1_i1~~c17147_g1_i1.p1  ORF type:complete len:479 (+),score=172.01 c17147_g1_i1:33-1439(+)